MNQYNPDLWVILKMVVDGEVQHRVLASWYGGYAGSDSWRMNSGITRAEQVEDAFLFHGQTGSTYVCSKGSGAYGMSSYTASVLAGWQRDAKDSTESPKVELFLLTEQEAKTLAWAPEAVLQ